MSPLPTLGVIGSSGGAALAAATACLEQSGLCQPWVLVSDRDCGMARWGRDREHIVHEVQYRDAETFSGRSLELFRDSGIRSVLLFYTRRIAAPLVTELDVCNIHPSLLPDYPGLGAVRRAFRDGSRIIGATLHRVDDGLDTGPRIAQLANALPPGASLALAERISYAQKVWLTLAWHGLVVQSSGTMNSPVTADAFDRFLAASGIPLDAVAPSRQCA